MTLNGYDISAYQSGLDPSQVPGDFVIVKVTGGDGYLNPNARHQLDAARAAGKLVGIYHFARDGYTGATADSEAEWFLHNAADLCDGQTLVVLDWEGDNETDVAYAKHWLDTVHDRTGVKPVIYMSFKTIQGADWSPVASADYGLWEAAYVLGYQRIDGYNPPAGLADIPYWSTRMMWQYTSTGYLPGWGDHLDLDEFYGDASTWAAYCAKNGVTTQSSTVTPIQEDALTPDDINAIAQATATEVLNRTIDREGPGQSGPTNLRAHVAWADAAFAGVNAHTDAAVKTVSVSLTDAQVQALAGDIAAKLPAGPSKDDIAAAVVAALGSKLKGA